MSLTDFEKAHVESVLAAINDFLGGTLKEIADRLLHGYALYIGGNIAAFDPDDEVNATLERPAKLYFSAAGESVVFIFEHHNILDKGQQGIFSRRYSVPRWFIARLDEYGYYKDE